VAQVEILKGECRSTCFDEDRWMQKQGHRVSEIVVEGGPIGGVVTMGGRMQVDMGQRTAGGREACLVRRPCDV